MEIKKKAFSSSLVLDTWEIYASKNVHSGEQVQGYSILSNDKRKQVFPFHKKDMFILMGNPHYSRIKEGFYYFSIGQAYTPRKPPTHPPTQVTSVYYCTQKLSIPNVIGRCFTYTPHNSIKFFFVLKILKLEFISVSISIIPASILFTIYLLFT